MNNFQAPFNFIISGIQCITALDNHPILLLFLNNNSYLCPSKKKEKKYEMLNISLLCYLGK